jgi:ribosomal protein S18 acetylase RimI-like enzyme
MIELLSDRLVLERVDADDITALTDRATAATFYLDTFTPEQVEANQRVVRIAADTTFAACANEHQLVTAAFVDDRFAGYVISTVHAPNDRELDWLMVDPEFHGSDVSNALMRAGMEWLGLDRQMWLNVIQHNQRAIRFYRKHGFEVDHNAVIDRVVPHFIMRRSSESEVA